MSESNQALPAPLCESTQEPLPSELSAIKEDEHTQPVFHSNMPPRPKNVSSILALVSSLFGLAFAPILTVPCSLLGLYFSIKGIRNSKAAGKGAKMAWISLAICIFMLVCVSILLFTFLALDASYA